MKNLQFTVIVIITFFFNHGTNVLAQEYQSSESIKLAGPRVGVTIITSGEITDKLKEKWDVSPVISQFGWQFETKFFTLDSGTTGLIEGVILLGGLEQNVILPSGTFLIGIRGKKGTEFGFGPNLSLSGVAFAFAVGFSKSIGEVNFPINFAVVPSDRGVRLSLLVGFNASR